MSVDPLEQFRARRPETGGSHAVITGHEGYSAFATKDRVERLQIVAKQTTRWPGYHYLMDVVADGTMGTSFVLLFSFMTLVVRGKNLQGAVAAIAAGTCSVIEEFDGKKWPPPADGEPVIQSIEFITEGEAEPEEVQKELKRA